MYLRGHSLAAARGRLISRFGEIDRKGFSFFCLLFLPSRSQGLGVSLFCLFLFLFVPRVLTYTNSRVAMVKAATGAMNFFLCDNNKEPVSAGGQAGAHRWGVWGERKGGSHRANCWRRLTRGSMCAKCSTDGQGQTSLCGLGGLGGLGGPFWLSLCAERGGDEVEAKV